jgi:hypothetical protein
MAKIEVDEGQYNQMLALQSVASKIVANPAARRRLEEAHKLVDPNASTPLLDQERLANEPLTAMKGELSAEIAALKKEREDERREQTLASIADKQTKAFNRLKTEHRYTDEGVEAVRKLMETKGLLDVDDAVAIFEKANPPAVPATPGGGMTGTSWGFADVNADSDKLIQELISTKGESTSVADRMANNALQDFRAGRR